MRFLLTAIIAYVFVIPAFAEEATIKTCDSSKSSAEFYECLLTVHPEYRAALITRDSAKAMRDRTTQFSNPELSLRTVGGKKAEENMGSTELAASFDVSNLVLKRSAISDLGRSEEKLGNILADEEEFRARSGIIKDLFRYRQIEDELNLVNEALGMFDQIIGQFRSRRVMGPEQQITLNLVELATGEYQLQRNHLNVEKQELDTKYKAIFGSQFQMKKQWIPQLKTNWPQVSLANISGETFELRRAQAESSRASAEKSLATADAFPQVSAGPIWERTTEGPTKYQSMGFGVSVSVPILSWNGGARELAAQNKLKSQIIYDYTVKKENLAKRMIFDKYHSAIEILKKSVTADAVRKKHDRVDSLFRQGLATGATVIEAHRQILAFTESQHEHEITALESYLYLSVLSGVNLFEVFK